MARPARLKKHPKSAIPAYKLTRPVKAILADPLALERELAAIRDKHPAAVARHANCPLWLWLELLGGHPRAAFANPVYAMFQVEALPAIEATIFRYADGWLYQFRDLLPVGGQEALCIDLLERTLPWYDYHYSAPELAKLPREVIAYRRAKHEGIEWNGPPLEVLMKYPNERRHSMFAGPRTLLENLMQTNTYLLLHSMRAMVKCVALASGREIEPIIRQETIWQWYCFFKYLPPLE